VYDLIDYLDKTDISQMTSKVQQICVHFVVRGQLRHLDVSVEGRAS